MKRRMRRVRALRQAAQRLDRQLRGVTVSAGSGASLRMYAGDRAAAVEELRSGLGQSSDLKERELVLAVPGGPVRRATLLFLDSLTDAKTLNEALLRFLLSPEHLRTLAHIPGHQWGEALVQAVAPVSYARTTRSFPAMIQDLLDGMSVLLVDEVPDVVLLDTKQYKGRGVEKPEAEQAVLGSLEAFTDTLQVNLGLIRRRLRSEDLRVRTLRVGSRTSTHVAVVYLEGVAQPRLVRTVIRRIRELKVAGVVTGGVLKLRIRDGWWSPFPTIRSTERTDLAVRELVSGRVVVAVDNTPYVLLVPANLFAFYQTTQDYVFSFHDAVLIRWVRLLALVIALYLPSLYVAMVSIHPNLIPTDLLLTIATSTETIPFPPVLEVLLMWTVMEILREASLRLPKVMGSTLSIVGGLVIGQAAVSAGIIGSPMVVVVALTAVAAFTAPAIEISSAWRVLLWPMVFAGYALGLPGIALLTVATLAHLARLHSFGTPYLAPLSPLVPSDMGDTLFYRVPLTHLTHRPRHLRTQNPRLATDPYTGETDGSGRGEP